MTTPAINLATVVRRVLALACLLTVLVASVATGTADESGRLPVEQVVVTTAQGDVSFDAEIAITDETRSRGLMFRRAMGEREAMLFYWDPPEMISMWMRNTYISLDMLFADAEGVVVHVAADTVPHSLDVIRAIQVLIESKPRSSSLLVAFLFHKTGIHFCEKCSRAC